MARETIPWRTVVGVLSAAELERGCAARGVRLDRARRTYWQAQGLFPLPEVRWLGNRRGSRGYYHRDAPLLATLLDYALRRDHPRKARPWRCPRGALLLLLDSWRQRSSSSDPRSGEEAFFRVVEGALVSIDAGKPSEIDPALARLDEPKERSSGNRRSGEDAAPRGRWRTAVGVLSAAELERACAARGVRLDRARRTYWQAQGLFPLPQVRSGLGLYHEDAPALAALIDRLLLAPRRLGKRQVRRWSPPALAALIESWRGLQPPAAGGQGWYEDAFYARVREALGRIAKGGRVELGM